MKAALLADIHANADALAAVLDAATREEVERYFILGDFVGYYYAATEMWAHLDRIAWSGIRGNHEDMLAQWRAGRNREAIRRRYGSGIEIASAELSDTAIETLLSLPDRRAVEIAGRHALLCHGSPWDPTAYVYPDAGPEIVDRLFGDEMDLVLFGHSHYPSLWRRNGRIAVNPGSVGQPRDRKGGACWALWNTETQDIALRREHYDVSKVVESCRRYDPDNDYLASILSERR
jgi:predicted phosphodiesterase